MQNRIFVNDYFIRIEADSTDEDMLRLLSFCPRIEKGRKKIEYYCSLMYLPVVLKYLRGINTLEECPEGNIRERYRTVETQEARTALLKKYGPTASDPLLWTHQSMGVELAEINKRYGFFYDTRTGKTLMALKIMYNALKRNEAKRCLVICPSSIIQSWLADAAKYPELQVVAYYGKDRWKAIHTPAHIVIWSLELVADSLEVLLATNFDICFFDESSKIKSHKAKISDAALDLSLTIPRWYLLSATPAPNNESEYYTQMKTIDPYCFPSARTHFVNRYFTNTSRNNNYEKLVLRPEMAEEFNSILATRSIYVDQSVMPIAGKYWHTVYFELENGLKPIYNRMREDRLVEIEGTNISSTMAAAIRAKLNQITSGFVMDTDAIKENKKARMLCYEEIGTEVYHLSDYRLVEMQRLITDVIGEDKKLIVWANYKAEFVMLEKFFGQSARYLRGGTSLEYKQDSIAAFKAGTVKHLVCHPLSVGMGINLVEAYNAIYFSCTDSWEALKQSSERIAGHISVQPHECNYYVMIAKDTVDEMIYKNVSGKRDASYGLFEHLKAEALE